MAARSQTDYIKSASWCQSGFRDYCALSSPAGGSEKCPLDTVAVDSIVFGICGFLGSLKIHSGE